MWTSCGRGCGRWRRHSWRPKSPSTWERDATNAPRSGLGNAMATAHRERRWDTRVGSMQLRVPRVRDGSYFPTLLEPRRRAERARARGRVVQEADVQGVSTRRVDELVQALGLAGISKRP